MAVSDSTAAALLLQKEFDITGFFMNIGQPDFDQQSHRVAELAERIGFPVEIVDLTHLFKQNVVDYFARYYLNGLTPNPCVVCNRDIKFGVLFDTILKTGIEQVATGHYARIVKSGNEHALLKGTDSRKDQSYFLARVDREKLKKIIFPLGSMQKNDVYRFVQDSGFTCFDGKESQDICFLEQTNIASFLEQKTNTPFDGPVVTTDGTTIGTHHGLFRYTIGQRRGLGLPDTSPWYVCGLNAAKNQLVVGKEKELYRSTLSVTSAHWLTKQPPPEESLFEVKIRYSHAGARAAIHDIKKDTFKIRFEEPQRAIAPGQFAVLYDNDRIVCSGEIR